MKFRGGEFSTGTKGNFQSELTYSIFRISFADTTPGKRPGQVGARPNRSSIQTGRLNAWMFCV